MVKQMEEIHFNEARMFKSETEGPAAKLETTYTDKSLMSTQLQRAKVEIESLNNEFEVVNYRTSLPCFE